MAYPFKYLAILDFEATCDDVTTLKPQEIIEIPILLLNTTTYEIDYQFHSYVRPTIHPKLTTFATSTELTGITQEVVDKADPIRKVWPRVLQFLKHRQLIASNQLDPAGNNTMIFVTCGDWDLKTMLPIAFRGAGWVGFSHHSTGFSQLD